VIAALIQARFPAKNFETRSYFLATIRMTLTIQRRFVVPGPNETVEQLAARAMPHEAPDIAVEKIKGWNLHIFAMRRPRGLLLGSDVVFVEPPQS
jgi:hypothetical protein